MRAGGAGIPAFYCKAGLGTPIEYGGFPLKFSHDGRSVEKYSEPKETREFNGETFLLEESI